MTWARYTVAAASLPSIQWSRTQTSSPTGQQLHHHATLLAELILERVQAGTCSISQASHIEAIHEAAIIEAFPNQFLAVLIAEANLPRLNRDASDRFWELLVACGGLEQLLARLLPGRSVVPRLEHITNHDQRAAVVCALTGLSVFSGEAVGVGDPADGDIFLPPASLWGASRVVPHPWAETALRQNAVALRSRPPHIDGHRHARVRLHDRYWFH